MLPDSQMDRFMLRLSIGYPEHEDAIEMVRRKQAGMSTEDVSQIVTHTELLQLKQSADSVYIKDSIIEYIVTLCERTRTDPRILQGASPRATLALTALAKATAWIQGRDYVLPRDVRFIFSDCIEHRLIWVPELAQAPGRFQVLEEIYDSVPAPAIR
jgi:MoxR-like ATPase